MLPWGHAGLGYVGYHVWLRMRGRLPPSGEAAIALVVGTQVPDLVDKPATWIFAVLPSGRSLGHSLVTLAVVTTLVVALSRYSSDRTARAWWALLGGWFAHLVGDAYAILFDPTTCVRYLLWPLIAHCVYPNDDSTLGWLAAFEFSPRQFAGLGVALIAAVLWWHDGRPGLEVVRRWALRWLPTGR